MRQIAMTALTLSVVVALGSIRSTAGDAKKVETQPDNKLVGTWTLLSAKYGGREVKLPEGQTRLKHVTTTQFMWASHDKDGKVGAALGGPYTLMGDKYEEMPEYGMGGVLDLLKGKPQSFEWKVEGNTWQHNGKLSTGLTIEEVWQRVEKK